MRRNTASAADGAASQTNGNRGNVVSTASRAADLDDQRAARIEMRCRLLDDRAHGIEPVFAAGQRHRRLVQIFRRQRVHRGRGDVRRIADDEVVALVAQVGEQIRPDQVDAIGKAVVAHVALRDRQRVRRQVRGVDVGVGIGVRQQDREATRAGAKVERALYSRRIVDVRRNAVRQQLRNVRARNDDAIVDVEAESAEPRFARQVRGGDTQVDAAREQACDLHAFRRGEARVEKRLQPVERQVERMQQQVGGLVVGVRRAVTEHEPGFAEPRHRPAQPVPQCFEFVRHGQRTPTLAAIAAALPPEGE